jgi:hypothetical protein
MATTDIMQTVDYRKQSPLTHTSCSLVDNIKEHKQIIIPQNNTPIHEEVIQKPKYSFTEIESVRKARLHSLSHWPHFTPSNESMAASGWFSCNVSDRVICIYCDTICHEWTINDDPAEVHARLAPQCPFVRSMPSNDCSRKIVNNVTEKFEPTHPAMAEISRREKTFSTIPWSENSPSIEELVRAGFFCSGVANTVTCFYCNGSLHKWGPKDNPMIEHARWFPHCLYAKHLCGNRLYQQIQMSKKRILPENKISADELSRIVAARLDLPIVQRLRPKYQISVIKRCLEDQFRIKNDDFITDTDFTMACLILQKQIEIIKGCKDKLIIPSNHQHSEDSTQTFKQSLGECFICLTEEKQLACMPCGHLCACVPCGYALKSCPICREKIQSFVRINS